jgi:hypothetical protein
VLRAGQTPIAFLELPPIRPELPPLSPAASAAEREQHVARAFSRGTFRVTAAGIRDDLLGEADAVRVFRAVLYPGFVRARALGYDTVEAIARWERHPRLEQKFKDYPGCVLVERFTAMKGYLADIEKAALENTDYRRVLYTADTAEHSQLVLTSLLPGEEVGQETHHLDQFIRIEQH